MVLVSREDPGLGLHRFRLTGELTELRGPDLRFSASETRQLLADAGIELSPAGVARLHDRSEGWAAGLRLAAISLAEHPDPERFAAEFSGTERTVARYLMAEVLERQPIAGLKVAGEGFALARDGSVVTGLARPGALAVLHSLRYPWNGRARDPFVLLALRVLRRRS